MSDLQHWSVQRLHHKPRVRPRTSASLAHAHSLVSQARTRSSIVLTRSVHTQDSTTRSTHVCAVQLAPFSKVVALFVPSVPFSVTSFGTRCARRLLSQVRPHWEGLVQNALDHVQTLLSAPSHKKVTDQDTHESTLHQHNGARVRTRTSICLTRARTLVFHSTHGAWRSATQCAV